MSRSRESDFGTKRQVGPDVDCRQVYLGCSPWTRGEIHSEPTNSWKTFATVLGLQERRTVEDSRLDGPDDTDRGVPD